MEEALLRLEELLFPATADVAVLSVAVDNEAIRIEVRGTAVGAACPGCGSRSSRATPDPAYKTPYNPRGGADDRLSQTVVSYAVACTNDTSERPRMRAWFEGHWR
ncbi:hypothetical protein ACFU8Q_34795 [Streptomyces sp. NPDC057543]|uniref:hypothetical protein n=1 Tax=Streptomyces sp. NPDC057543 TaxID=3346163 RepID=UPI003676CA3E